MKTHMIHKYFFYERLCSVHYVILHQLYLPTKLYRGIKCRINWHKEGVGSSNTEHTHTIIHVGRLIQKYPDISKQTVYNHIVYFLFILSKCLEQFKVCSYLMKDSHPMTSQIVKR